LFLKLVAVFRFYKTTTLPAPKRAVALQDKQSHSGPSMKQSQFSNLLFADASSGNLYGADAD
jgi:hypothetical protein